MTVMVLCRSPRTTDIAGWVILWMCIFVAVKNANISMEQDHRVFGVISYFRGGKLE